jgi:hypothetical protein
MASLLHREKLVVARSTTTSLALRETARSSK